LLEALPGGFCGDRSVTGENGSILLRKANKLVFFAIVSNEGDRGSHD
jgi:predicted regulator of Ras-like GTPase activity (Roadblock/LC7/MglB family)